TEAGPGLVPDDEASGHGGVVAEADPVGVPAVGGDRQPHLVGARADAELPEGARPRRLDDDVGVGDQLLQCRVVEVEGDALLSAVEEVEELPRSATGPVRT